MTKSNTTGMDRKAVAANNNINNYKFYVAGMADFADFAEAIDFIKENNWAMRVRGYDNIRVGLNRNMDGEYTASMVVLSEDCATAVVRKDIALGKRMTQNKVERIAIEVLDLIDKVEKMNTENSDTTLGETSMETPMEKTADNTAEMNSTLGLEETLDSDAEWEKTLENSERMNNIVISYQTEFDGYMEDLKKVAPSFYAINTKIDAFAAKMIVGKMAQIGKDLLRALGEYSGCEMTEDDGYWLDTTELCRWGSIDYYVDDMEGLAETLDYVIAESALDFGVDAEDLEFINDGGCYCFDGYPTYLWDDMREFAATYYHYAYCA